MDEADAYKGRAAGLSTIRCMKILNLIHVMVAQAFYRWAMREINPLCLLYTSPSPRDGLLSRMPSSA